MFASLFGGSAGKLISAASEGKLVRVEKLLAAGADIDGLYRGSSALVVAAHGGHLELVRLLRRRGARLDATLGPDGTTALHAIAQFATSPEMADAVLGDVRQVDLSGEIGFTPLCMACMFGRFEFAKALIARGANANAVVRGAAADQHVNGQGPITLAIQAGNAQLVTLLAAHGADVTREVADGITVLGFAIASGCEFAEGQVTIRGGSARREFDVVDALCRAGADPNAPMGRGPLAGQTPLTLAMRAPGAAPTRRDALSIAAWVTARVNVVNWLMNNGADATCPGPDGRTPLQLALDMGDVGAMFTGALTRGG